MAFSQTHLITSFLVIICPTVASLSFDLPKFPRTTQEIVLEGVAARPYIVNDTTIELTSNEKNTDPSYTAGRATYSKPLHLWDNGSGELASFSTNFTFVIDSKSYSNYGDGPTFFLAQNNSDINTGGAMGLPISDTMLVPSSQFVAVEFDTYTNGWDPHNVRDHVGISISSLTSVTYRKWFSDITGGRECQAWITYDSVSNNLSVSFTDFGENNTVVDKMVSFVGLFGFVYGSRVGALSGQHSNKYGSEKWAIKSRWYAWFTGINCPSISHS